MNGDALQQAERRCHVCMHVCVFVHIYGSNDLPIILDVCVYATGGPSPDMCVCVCQQAELACQIFDRLPIMTRLVIVPVTWTV